MVGLTPFERMVVLVPVKIKLKIRGSFIYNSRSVGGIVHKETIVVDEMFMHLIWIRFGLFGENERNFTSLKLYGDFMKKFYEVIFK